MLNTLKKKLKSLVDADEKTLKRLSEQVEHINELESQFEALSDADLKSQTEAFRKRYDEGESLEDLLYEAFAATREAARRNIGMRHYDVQMLGGIVLHQGKIAEMGTGEGKTLVATSAVYLNAIATPPVHVVTPNDYLARRDATWMGAVYSALGMSVGCIQSNNGSYVYDGLETKTSKNENNKDEAPLLKETTRQQAYQCDVLYGTNNEFGFDYLRDNMRFSLEEMVQNGGNNADVLHRFAVVDEVDNILIDEARTPLIISTPAPNLSGMFQRFAQIAKQLSENRDFELDRKKRQVNFTTEGIARIEKLLGIKNLYSAENQELSHYAENAVRAKNFYFPRNQYIVKDGDVILIDEFTGRLTPGRRLSEGLHEAIEAQEGVKIRRRTMTRASVTIQNYFRLYDKLAGMTGTATSDAEELYKIYKLDVVRVPTNKPGRREDLPDQIFLTQKAKWKAIADKILELHKESVPVLVGTTSVEKSEILAKLLRDYKVKPEVLNARNHAREADIIASAGEPGSVTVSTNMAGRGTDIILGGQPDKSKQNGTFWEQENLKVKEMGGLFVLGTERHESRRIDNQLRGRSGRQGDVGRTQFFLSMEDDLVKRFGGERIKNTLERLNWEEDETIENRMLTYSINSAQRKVEAHNFEIRKHLVDYDDVMNAQRVTIYKLRRRFLKNDGLRELLEEYVTEYLHNIIDSVWKNGIPKERIPQIRGLIFLIIPRTDVLPDDAELLGMSQSDIKDLLQEQVKKAYDERESQFGAEELVLLYRITCLKILDSRWTQHLTAMDNMRQSIGLQAVGQRDPLTQYKHRAFQMFSDTVEGIRAAIARTIFRVKKAKDHSLNRNDPCHCGSGKKFKKCHGA